MILIDVLTQTNDSLANGDATIKLRLISSRKKGEEEHEKEVTLQ